MGWDSKKLFEMIRANTEINQEKLEIAEGAYEGMEALTAQALRFIIKKEKTNNESKTDYDS